MPRFLLALSAMLFFLSCAKEEQVPVTTTPSLDLSNAEYYQSLPKQKSFFQKIDKPSVSALGDILTVNLDQTFQTMDGFGLALTGGSAQVIYRLEPVKRAALLQELFGKNGMTVLRISIGASDLDSAVFSYEEERGMFSLE